MKPTTLIIAGLTLALLFPTIGFTEKEYAEAQFQIDVANEMQQLSWMSQMAYRVSDYQKKITSGELQGNNEVFCDAPLLKTDTIIKYLNKNHADTTISAEQAIATVFMELGAAYPCKE